MTDKKDALTFLSKALIFAAVLLFGIMMLAMLFQWISFRGAETSVNAAPTNLPVVILDAGHGGVDSGAVSRDGTEEKHLNLALTKKLGAILEASGVRVVYTRTDDVLLTCDGAPTRKTGDLMARVNTAKENPEAIFVSIHMNTLPQTRYSGLQTFYTDNHTLNRALAQVIQNNAKLVQKENRREAKDAKSAVYILDRIQNPAVLVECGFLSNPEECALLQQDDYQNRLAFVLAHSILSFALEENV